MGRETRDARFVARPARYIKGHFPPRYAPRRALAWGYDCVALRVISLRDFKIVVQ